MEKLMSLLNNFNGLSPLAIMMFVCLAFLKNTKGGTHHVVGISPRE
jgi:hypothetical protein